MSATEETLRSTVGRDADVPRKRRLSDMTEYTGGCSEPGTRFASVTITEVSEFHRELTS